MTSWATFTELVALLQANNDASKSNSTTLNNELRFGSYKLRDLYDSMDDFAVQYPLLLDAIRQNTSITHLYLELDSSDESSLSLAATPFLDAFSNLPNLQSIHAESCGGCDAGFDFRGLHRVLNKLGTGGGAARNTTDAADRNKFNNNNNKLTSLVLQGRNCKWTPSAHAVMFATSLARLTSLKKFELLEFGYINEMDPVHLREIEFGDGNFIVFSPTPTIGQAPVPPPLPLTSILLALGRLHSLELVKISLVPRVSNAGARPAAVSLYSTLYSALPVPEQQQQEVGNTDTNTSNSNVIGRLLQLPNLQELEFSGLTFHTHQADAFSTHLPARQESLSSSRSRLTTLTFCSCRFVDECAAMLFLGLQHNTSLKLLYFHWVHVDYLSARIFNSLAMAIRNNSTLSCLRLDLCSSDKRSVPHTAMLQVFEAIKVNTSLRSIGLELEEAVMYSPHDLNAFCAGIADLIRVNECLKEFNFVLSQDPSGCAQQEAMLVAAIKENFTIEFCNVRPIQWGAASSLIDIYTRLNLHGRIYLKKHGANQQARGVELLSAVRQDLDCLFVHLLENPGLCCRTK